MKVNYNSFIWLALAMFVSLLISRQVFARNLESMTPGEFMDGNQFGTYAQSRSGDYLCGEHYELVRTVNPGVSSLIVGTNTPNHLFEDKGANANCRYKPLITYFLCSTTKCYEADSYGNIIERKYPAFHRRFVLLPDGNFIEEERSNNKDGIEIILRSNKWYVVR